MLSCIQLLNVCDQLFKVIPMFSGGPIVGIMWINNSLIKSLYSCTRYRGVLAPTPLYSMCYRLLLFLCTSWHPPWLTGFCLLPPCAHHHVPHHQLMPDISSHPGACANSHSPSVSQQARTAAGYSYTASLVVAGQCCCQGSCGSLQLVFGCLLMRLSFLFVVFFQLDPKILECLYEL